MAQRHLVRHAPVDIHLRQVQPVQTQNAISVYLVGIISRMSVITARTGVPVRQVRTRRRILCIMVQNHLVRHAVGAQSIVRPGRHRVKRLTVDIIQLGATPVVITVQGNHNARVQRIVPVAFRTVVRRKRPDGRVMVAPDGQRIPNVTKHVRQHRSAHIAVPVH